MTIGTLWGCYTLIKGNVFLKSNCVSDQTIIYEVVWGRKGNYLNRLFEQSSNSKKTHFLNGLTTPKRGIQSWPTKYCRHIPLYIWIYIYILCICSRTYVIIYRYIYMKYTLSIYIYMRANSHLYHLFISCTVEWPSKDTQRFFFVDNSVP